MGALKIIEVGKAVTFAVRTLPRSDRNEVVGVQGDALKVKLTAPPVEGAANAALIEFLAQQLGVRKSAVAIVGGIRNRNKVVRVEGTTRERVELIVTSSVSL